MSFFPIHQSLGKGLLPALLAMVFCIGCRPPSASDQAPGELIRRGWSFFRMGEFDLALTAFSEAQGRSEPGSGSFFEARYGWAVTQELKRPNPEPAEARRIYKELEAGESEVGAWASLRLARMEHLYGVDAKPDFAAIRRAYENVIERFPEHPAAKEAFLLAQSTYLAHGNRQETEAAVARLEAFLRDNPQSPFGVSANALLAEAYESLQDPQKQMEAEIALLNAQPQNVQREIFANRAPAYWRIATLAEYRLGDVATAKTYYQRILDEYPNDQRSFGAKMAMERMTAAQATEERSR